MVIETNALYAYQAAAGVFLDRAITASQDMDVLWDVRTKLSFAMDEGVKPENFMDILRKVNKTFDFYGKQKYRVVNQKGYMIDLLKTVPPDIFSKERNQMGGPDDIVAIEVMNLHWLLSSPKFEHIVIGDDGLPAKMLVPDPRDPKHERENAHKRAVRLRSWSPLSLKAQPHSGSGLTCGLKWPFSRGSYVLG